MYKKSQTLNDLILWMQDTDDGISLKDIMKKYDVSLRTAVRMKDSIAEKYPELKEISGPYNTKRWCLPKGTGCDMVSFSMEEIHALQNASKLLASKKMIDSRYIDNVLHKIKALIGKDAINRIEPDAEALLEAEGYAFRPGPKIIINTEHLKQLRYFGEANFQRITRQRNLATFKGMRKCTTIFSGCRSAKDSLEQNTDVS